jgi:hypothetical protein
MIDTHAEMAAGYTVATVIYAGYMLSLWLRARRVRAVILSAAKNRSGADSDSSLRSE